MPAHPCAGLDAGLSGRPLVKKPRPTVEQLLPDLASPDYHVRSQAIRVLGRTRDPRVVELLLDALRDSTVAVRAAAASTLVKLGDDRALVPFVRLLTDRSCRLHRLAHKGLLAAGERAVPALSEALGARDSRLRTIAAGLLAQIGHPSALGPLLNALGDPDERVRYHAVEGLGRLGAPQALEPLVTILRDESSGLRNVAAASLGSLGDRRAVPPLLEALRDANPELRHRAATALGTLGDRAAVGPLIEALDDPHRWVRVQAALALGALRAAEAVPMLERLMEADGLARWYPHSAERRAATWAIARIRGEGDGQTAMEALVGAG